MLFTGLRGFLGRNFQYYNPDYSPPKSLIGLRNGFILNELSNEDIDYIKENGAVIAGGITNFSKIENNPMEAIKANIFDLKKTLSSLISESVHITYVSSESVFDGSRAPYTHNSIPNPTFLYGEMKYAIERFLGDNTPTAKYSIIRLPKMYSLVSGENNFIVSFLEYMGKAIPYPVIDDITTAPLNVRTACEAITRINSEKSWGCYNLCGNISLTRSRIISIINNHLCNKYSHKYKIYADYASRKSIPIYKDHPENTTMVSTLVKSLSDIVIPDFIKDIEYTVDRYMSDKSDFNK